MAKFEWQNGTLVSKAKVEIDGKIYEVEPEQYSGQTPLSAENLNQMQDGIYEDIDKNKEDIVTLKYNLETNGSAIKTGRQIDGKDEYVKRFKVDSYPNNSVLEINTGLDNKNVNLITFQGKAENPDSQVLPIPFVSLGNGGIQVVMQLSKNILSIVTSVDRSDYNGYIDMYFTYKN